MQPIITAILMEITLEKVKYFDRLNGNGDAYARTRNRPLSDDEWAFVSLMRQKQAVLHRGLAAAKYADEIEEDLKKYFTEDAALYFKTTPQFSEIGGALLGAFNFTWPFAKLILDPQSVQLHCLGRKYRFNKNEIRGLHKYEGLFSIGINIEHAQAGYPGPIVFWTFSYKKLKQHLDYLGYKTRD